MDPEDKNQKPNLSPPPNLPSTPSSLSSRPLPPIPPPVSKPPTSVSLPPPSPKIPPPPIPAILPPRPPSVTSPKPESDRPTVSVPKVLESTTPPPQKKAPEGFGGFSSSIRTMQGDIDSILKGKRPSGETFEKKMEGAIKTPPPPPPLSPAPMTPKGPLVKLGETQKAKPILPSSMLGFPSVPKPEEKKIAVPPPGRPVISKPVILLLAIIIVAGGFSYWFFILRQAEPETPVAEVTPTSTPTSFEPSVPVVEEKLVINPGGDPLGQLDDFVKNTTVGSGDIKVMDAVDQLGQKYNFSRFFKSFLVDLPQDAVTDLNIDNFKFLLFNQTENFGNKTINKSYGFAVEVLTESNLVQSLRNWELSMSENIGMVLGLNTANSSTPDFQDNFFKGTVIRYKNFPSADETIDYVVVSGTNGKSYFVFTNSRESIYSVINNFNSLILPHLQPASSPSPLSL